MPDSCSATIKGFCCPAFNVMQYAAFINRCTSIYCCSIFGCWFNPLNTRVIISVTDNVGESTKYSRWICLRYTARPTQRKQKISRSLFIEAICEGFAALSSSSCRLVLIGPIPAISKLKIEFNAYYHVLVI